MLQYADDTLILTRGDVASLQALKNILDDFSMATGLTINYHKSTFVPMNVDAATASTMVTVLGCELSTFPRRTSASLCLHTNFDLLIFSHSSPPLTNT